MMVGGKGVKGWDWIEEAYFFVCMEDYVGEEKEFPGF